MGRWGNRMVGGETNISREVSRIPIVLYPGLFFFLERTDAIHADTKLLSLYERAIHLTSLRGDGIARMNTSNRLIWVFFSAWRRPGGEGGVYGEYKGWGYILVPR